MQTGQGVDIQVGHCTRRHTFQGTAPGSAGEPGPPSGALTRVSPRILARRVTGFTVRSWDCCASSSMPCRTEAVPCLSIVEIKRASWWAGAVRACGAPRRAPEGGGRRLRPLPPATRGCGRRPHHEGQGGTVGQRVLSRALSRRMIKDVGSAMPSICVRATPRRRSRGARTAQAG